MTNEDKPDSAPVAAVDVDLSDFERPKAISHDHETASLDDDFEKPERVQRDQSVKGGQATTDDV